MKKSYLMIATAATLFAACANNDNFREFNSLQENNAIGFSTFTTKQTRAENSGETKYDALEAYNKTFRVWGNKYVNDIELDANNLTVTPIFGYTGEGTTASPYEYPGEKVEYKETEAALIGHWTYDPIRFWDKTATKYDFYAASPFTPKDASGNSVTWSFENSTKKISLPSFTVTGINRVETATNGVEKIGVLTTINKAAVMSFEQEDLMIATDIPAYTDYTYSTTAYANGVNLQFNHILSRLNIGIRKSSNLDNFKVILNSIKINNMYNNGKFDESRASSTSNPALADGTTARWYDKTTKFAAGTMKFEPATALEITSSATDNSFQYVYEGLVIPQNVGYSKTILVNEAAPASGSYLYIDGSNAVSTGADVSTWSNPYIVIDYEIQTSAGKKIDGYKYYFNLAEIFGATTNDGIDFCEGWQNTVKITLAPTAIKFDAEVAKWDEKFGDDNPKTGKLFNLQ